MLFYNCSLNCEIYEKREFNKRIIKKWHKNGDAAKIKKYKKYNFRFEFLVTYNEFI